MMIRARADEINRQPSKFESQKARKRDFLFPLFTCGKFLVVVRYMVRHKKAVKSINSEQKKGG